MNKPKVTFGSIKLPHHRGTPRHDVPEFISGDKQEIEFQLALYLSKVFIFHEKKKVSKIEVNPNDENKNADVFITINNKEKGIQITQLVFSKLVTRKKLAHKKGIDLALEIAKNYFPDRKISIEIHPKSIDTDWVPTGKKKPFSKLAVEIAETLKRNYKKILLKQGFSNFRVKNLKATELANSYSFLPIPDGHNSNYPGTSNLYINFGIDNVNFDTDDIKNEIKNLYDKKNEGNAEYLLIWADVYEIQHNQERIIKELEDQFENSTFEQVYFMFFRNKENEFSENIRIAVIRKEEK